jgi:hypothetical protein
LVAPPSRNRRSEYARCKTCGAGTAAKHHAPSINLKAINPFFSSIRKLVQGLLQEKQNAYNSFLLTEMTSQKQALCEKIFNTNAAACAISTIL